MAKTEHNLDSLPVWARQRIERLQREVESLESRVVGPPSDARITKNILVSGGTADVPVADDYDSIHFRLERSGDQRKAREPSIEVRFQRMMLNQRSMKVLDLNTPDGRLILMPGGANNITMRVEEF